MSGNLHMGTGWYRSHRRIAGAMRGGAIQESAGFCAQMVAYCTNSN